MSSSLRTFSFHHHAVHGLAWLGALLLLPGTVFATNSVVAFGLTFTAKEGASVSLDENNFPVVQAVETPSPQPEPWFGASVLLGEADTGVFINPGTDFESESFVMRGEAYGSLNGVAGQTLVTMRGSRSGYAYYSVEADLSALGPQSWTYILLDGNRQITETTVDEPDLVTADFSNTWTATPRVNPFWRMPCGSIGALVEFDGNAYVRLPGWIEDEEAQQGTGYGNRVFIRANNPTNTVNFVSQVDAYADLGLATFSFTDARPGVFGRGHKALGEAILSPSVGLLTLSNLVAAETFEDASGVAIELDEAMAFAGPGEINPVVGAGQFTVNLLPVDLTNNGASLALSMLGIIQGEERLDFGSVAGSTWLLNEAGSLRIRPTLPGNRVGVAVYEQGQPVGTVLLPEFATEVDVAGAPRVLACGARANSMSSPPGYFFRFDSPTTFTATNGISLAGDEIHVQAVEVGENGTNGVRISSYQTCMLAAGNLPILTITSEAEQGIELPELTIQTFEDYVVVSWPDPNRVFLLEAAPVVEGPFFTVPDPITWSGNTASVRVSTEASSQVFRLGTQRRTRHID